MAVLGSSHNQSSGFYDTMGDSFEDEYQEGQSYSMSGSVRGLEGLIKAAQQQQLRQLKRIQQMKKSAQQANEMRRAWTEKEQMLQEREQQMAQEQLMQQLERAMMTAQADARRQMVVEAAQQAEEKNRQRLEAKLKEADDRMVMLAKEKQLRAEYNKVKAMQATVRRDDIYRRSLAAAEARRNALIEREQAVNKRLHEHEQLQKIQAAIKKEEEFMKELQRQQVYQRAEQEEQSRVEQLTQRQQQKEVMLEQRKQESDLLRAMRAEEARMRFENIQQAAAEAAAQEMAKRDQLRQKLEEKMQRADIINEQRQQLVNEMAAIRREMNMREQVLKEALEKMSYSASGELPPEIEDLEQQLTMRLGTMTTTKDTTRSSTRRRSQSERSSIERPRTAPSYGTGSRAQSFKYYPPTSGTNSPRAAASRSLERPSTAPRQLEGSTSGKVRSGVNGVGITTSSRREKELQAMLEHEVFCEMEREEMLKKITDPKEFKRLSKIFELEREQARKKIVALSSFDSRC